MAAAFDRSPFDDAIKINSADDETGNNLRDDACVGYARSVIKVEGERSGWIPGTKQVSDGSGFYVSEDGLAVTDAHVVNEFGNLKVHGSDGEWHSTKVVARDDANDLALLKVDLPPGVTVTTVQLEPDSTNLSMHQHLTAVGYPGKSNVIVNCSEGTVDGRASVSQITNQPNPGEDANRKVVAIAATGDDGMSGGPIFNDNGRLAGISDKAATNTTRGNHIFMTPVEPIHQLLAAYRSAQ